jgi:hypothetical protein
MRALRVETLESKLTHRSCVRPVVRGESVRSKSSSSTTASRSSDGYLTSVVRHKFVARFGSSISSALRAATSKSGRLISILLVRGGDWRPRSVQIMQQSSICAAGVSAQSVPKRPRSGGRRDPDSRRSSLRTHAFKPLPAKSAPRPATRMNGSEVPSPHPGARDIGGRLATEVQATCRPPEPVRSTDPTSCLYLEVEHSVSRGPSASRRCRATTRAAAAPGRGHSRGSGSTCG